MNDLGFNHKKKVFKVPENYFEELEKNILAQTVETKQKSIKIVSSKRKRYVISSIVGIAASLLIIVGVFFNINKASEETLSNEDLITIENSIYSTLLSNSDWADEDLLSYETSYFLE
ncbi:MAG: hypothetical protein ACK5MD_05945 [Flavobacteriales bacterium]